MSRGPAREDARRDIEHALATMQGHLDGIHAHEPGVRDGRDPEELHQMRTATRRLRADLRAVRDIFEPDEVARLRGELRWLGAALGAARDADVQRDYLRGLRGLTHGETVMVARLVQTLEREQARRRVAVLAALDTPRYQRLLRELDARIQHPPLVTEDFALRDVAAAAFARLRRVVEDLPATPSAQALHAVRLAVKRARYAAELAQRGRHAHRFVDKAVELQDILGEHQDAAITERRLRGVLRRARGVTARAGVRRLLDRQRARRAAARSAFFAEWPKLERRGAKAWE